MDPILDDFDRDLAITEEQLKNLKLLQEFSSKKQDNFDIITITSSLGKPSQEFIQTSISIHNQTSLSLTGINLTVGSLTLYIAGRFEQYIRTSFEDLCQRVVQNTTEFSKLPKTMQDALINQTAIVAQNPRKYGHAENGVRAFITTLAKNFDPTQPFTQINHECLSITESNMRPNVLSELFSRAGIKEIWPMICQQAGVLAYFGTADKGNAETQAKSKLNEIMELRNKIAHPSGETEWPSIETTYNNINFLRAVSRAISDAITVYAITLTKTS